MKYARIVDGVVAEIFAVPEGLTVRDHAEDTDRKPTIDDMFPAEFVQMLTSCPDEVEPGWTFSVGKFGAPKPFVAPEPPEASAGEKLTAFLAANPAVAAEVAALIGL